MPAKLPANLDKKLNFRRNLVKRHKFVGYLDEWLASEPDGFEYKHVVKQDDDAWHPSGHCIPDVVELYHFATSPRVPFVRTPATNKNFVVGHFWHQLLQYGTLQLGLADASAIECRASKVWGDKLESFSPNDDDSLIAYGHPYHWCTGAGDIAPLILPKHGEYLVDFKTMSGRAFKEVGLPSGFAKKYEAQINIYMELFDIEKALIVGVQKDTPHEFKEIEFVRNQPLIDIIFDKWKFVSECIDEGEEPTKMDADQFILDGLFEGPIAQ